MENEKELQNGEAVEETPVSPEENTEAPAEKETKKKGEKKAKAEEAKRKEELEALKAAPQGQPAHEEFQAGALPTTGDKRMDRLSRIMGAK